MLREIDTRIIPGVCSVVWYMAEGSHWISVRSLGENSPEQLSLREFDRGYDAALAFRHTFACPEVPNVFART